MQVPTLQEAYGRQLALCDQLEEIADSLPDRVQRQMCLNVARALPGVMHSVHAHEEAGLFAELRRKSGRGHEDLIEKLRLQQVADDCLAEEVQQELLLLAEARSTMAPEAVGYLLRGFFDGLRRHVSHSNELLAVMRATAKRDGPRPPA